jgi:hypothetical protein
MKSSSANTQISFHELVAIVKTLSVAEKQLLTEALWDDNMPVFDEHQNIVKERMEKSKLKPERMLNWESVSKSLS